MSRRQAGMTHPFVHKIVLVKCMDSVKLTALLFGQVKQYPLYPHPSTTDTMTKYFWL